MTLILHTLFNDLVVNAQIKFGIKQTLNQHSPSKCDEFDVRLGRIVEGRNFNSISTSR